MLDHPWNVHPDQGGRAVETARHPEPKRKLARRSLVAVNADFLLCSCLAAK